MILWPFIPNHYSTRMLHCWKAFKYHINSAHSCHFQRHWDESVGHKVPFHLPVKICGPSPWASQEGSEHSLAACCKPWASPAAHMVVASNRTSGQQQHTVQNSSSKTAGFWVLKWEQRKGFRCCCVHQDPANHQLCATVPDLRLLNRYLSLW